MKAKQIVEGIPSAALDEIDSLSQKYSEACPICNHQYGEHDDTGCKRVTCMCKNSQKEVIGREPLFFTQYFRSVNVSLDGPAIKTAPDLWIRQKTFSREYLGFSIEQFFALLAKKLNQTSYFKVWRVDEKRWSIEMTTHSTTLGATADTFRQNISMIEQVDVSVLEAANCLLNLQLRVTPSKWGFSPVYSTDLGIPESRADYIARMIFNDIVPSMLENSKT